MEAKLPKNTQLTIKGINVTLTEDTTVNLVADTPEQLAEQLSHIGVLVFNDNLSRIEEVDGKTVRVFYGGKGKKEISPVEDKDDTKKAASTKKKD